MLVYCNQSSPCHLMHTSVETASTQPGHIATPIARFMGPTWGPPGADRTQVGPMLAPWSLLSGYTTFRPVHAGTGSCQHSTQEHAEVNTIFPGLGIRIIKITQLRDHLIFKMEIPLLVRQVFMLKQTCDAYWYLDSKQAQMRHIATQPVDEGTDTRKHSKLKVVEAPEPHFNIKTIFPSTSISNIKIRWMLYHLLFIMEIPKLAKWHFYSPWTIFQYIDQLSRHR